VFDGAPVCFRNALPAHRSGRRELNNGDRRTDGKVTGVTDRTAVIVRVPVFVDCGSCLQTHKAGEQQRYQERLLKASDCEYTNHPLLFDDRRVLLVADCWREGARHSRSTRNLSAVPQTPRTRGGSRVIRPARKNAAGAACPCDESR